jgi:4-amino-4-deoxy-L-arabinose transferase-like glycosyltransferase
MRQEQHPIPDMRVMFLPFLFLFFTVSAQALDDYFNGNFPLHSGIVRCNADGQNVWFYPSAGNPNDFDILANGEEIVIASDNGNLEIVGLDGTQRYIAHFMPLSDVDCIDGQSLFLLTSREEQTVFFFNRQTNEKKIIPFPFQGPTDADLLPNGNILVCDSIAGFIVELTLDGEEVWRFDKDLKQPADALRTADGLTYIADFDNHRIRIVRNDGVVINDILGFDHPNKMTPLQNNAFLIADRDHQRLVELLPNKTLQIIREGINAVQVAYWLPQKKEYIFAVHNRFSPQTVSPSKVDQSPSAASTRMARLAERAANPYLGILLSLLLWGLSWFFQRRVTFSAFCFLLAYLLLFGVAFAGQRQARSTPPHVPDFPFWISSLFLLVYSYRYSKETIPVKQRFTVNANSPIFPFAWKTGILLMAISLLACLCQMVHYKPLFNLGAFPWYIPMLVWGLGMGILCKTLLPKNPEPATHPGYIVRLGTMAIALPHVQCNYAASHTPAEQQRAGSNTAVAVIILIAALLYTLNNAAIPTDVHGDEGEVALTALDIRDSGNWNIFRFGWYHIPSLFYLFPAWIMWLFGDSLAGIRMQGALFGLVSIPVFYLFARRLLHDPPAVLATLLFATSSYFIHYSRLGIGYNQATLFTVIVMYALTRAVQDSDFRFIAWAAIVSALGFLSYQATKIMLPLSVSVLALFWLYRVIPMKKAAMAIGLYLFVFGITIAPLVGNSFVDRTAAFSRASSVSVFSPQGRELMYVGFDKNLSIQEIVKIQLQRSFLAPVSYPDRSPYIINHHAGGILNTTPAVMWVGGVLLLLLGFFHPITMLLLFPTVMILIVGSALTNSAPAYQRLVVLYPFLILTATPLLYGVASHVMALLQLSVHTRKWVWCIVAALLMVCSGHHYFRTIQSVPQRVDEWTRVARYLDGISDTHYVYFMGPPHVSIRYGTLRFLAPDVKGENVEEPVKFFKQKVNRQGAVSFVLIRGNRKYIHSLRAMYPDGKEINYYNTINTHPFTVYEVNM